MLCRVLTVAALVLTVTLGWLLEFKWLVVRQVTCYLEDQSPCSTKLTAALSPYSGLPLFSPELKSFNQQLPTRTQGYRLLRQSQTWFGQLTFVFAAKPPLVSLANPGTQDWLLITDDGTFISQTNQPPAGTTKVTYAASYQPQAANLPLPLTAFIAALVNQLHLKGVPVATMQIFHDQVIAGSLPDQKTALFSAAQPVSRQVASLQLILTKATMDPNLPVIDVRYEKPVLRAAIPGQTSLSIESNH
ncbi:hypothetical protein A2W24_05895 [Microgenomates group bacterium RBG_16_45_19]|nr:MAG: hypothetical protein A2W24_05895 [Microgenomates group bacterium RBG_16_45_19]